MPLVRSTLGGLLPRRGQRAAPGLRQPGRRGPGPPSGQQAKSPRVRATQRLVEPKVPALNLNASILPLVRWVGLPVLERCLDARGLPRAAGPAGHPDRTRVGKGSGLYGGTPFGRSPEDSRASFASAFEAWQPARVTTAEGRSHGDLHGGNLLLDVLGNIWLIDFATTARGHALQDLAKLVVSCFGEYLPYHPIGLAARFLFSCEGHGFGPIGLP